MHPAFCEQLMNEQLQEALGTEGLFSPEMELVAAAYPELYIRFLPVGGAPRLLQFECTNYDFQAIQVRPVDPDTRAPLGADRYMTRSGGPFPGHAMLGGQPFLCLQGTRDYYTHEGHRPQVAGERWEAWRAELTLARLLTVIKSKFRTEPAAGGWA